MTIQTQLGTGLPFGHAAFDIDGTLKGIDHPKRGQRSVSLENIAGVRRMEDTGIIAMTATGRIEQQTWPFHRLAKMSGPMITSDAALVRFPKGEIISETAIPQGIVRDILSWLTERHITTLNHIGARKRGIRGGIYISYQNHWNRDMDRHREELGRKMYHCTAQDLQDAPNYKVLCAAPQQRADEIEPLARAEFGESVQFFRHSRQMFEFRALGVNKVLGLEAVAAYYGVDASSFVAFGDGTNDVEMLQWAGLGVAMDHGTAVAKAAAKLVVPSACAAVDLACAIDGVFHKFEGS
jgi:Cof subfamily protein (haloacid dehalogenase superfamily)